VKSFIILLCLFKHPNMKNTSIILLFAAISLGLTGCAKDGDMGPAGKDGTANVHTSTFVVSPANWQVSGSAGFGEIYCSLTDTNLTRGILDSGSVQVFQQLGYAEPLPITDVGTASWGTWLTITTANFTQNSIQIRRYRDDDSLPPVPAYSTTYKVVTIEGSR
jgi:hypothetical protein